MLRHIQHQRIYWFCRNCWQEMPNFQPETAHVASFSAAVELSVSTLNQLIATA
ncbi:MAG TPA: hypothetical protein V6D10_11115 [Trichocoleus sp.]